MPDINIVGHEKLLFKDFEGHFLDESTADVVFLVEGEKLPAHRLMLASHCRFFKTLLYEKGFKEANQDEVELKETGFNAFKHILEYFYRGRLDLDSIEIPTVVEILELSSRYGLKALTECVVKYLEIKVNKINVNRALEAAVVLGLDNLEEKCWWIIAMAVEGIYEEDLILELDPCLFRKFLLFCSGKVSAIKLFGKATKLLEKNQENYEENKLLIKELIDFARISTEDLYGQVLDSNVFGDKEFIALTQELNKKGWLEEPKIVSNPKWKMVDGNNILDFGCIILINRISYQLPLKGSYKYSVEVSTDIDNWLTVYNPHEVAICYGQQGFYFTEIGVRYIRFKLLVSDQELKSLLQTVEVSYVSEPPAHVNGYVWHIEKMPRSYYFFNTSGINDGEENWIYREEPLDLESEDKTIPFISQKLSLQSLVKYCFCVCFNRPQLLNSFRFRLWDYDGRKYNLMVQIGSGFSNKLEIVSVKKKELVGGLQTITFSPRPVSRILIYCYKTTKGDDLRISYFEAPAQLDSSTP